MDGRIGLRLVGGLLVVVVLHLSHLSVEETKTGLRVLTELLRFGSVVAEAGAVDTGCTLSLLLTKLVKMG